MKRLINKWAGTSILQKNIVPDDDVRSSRIVKMWEWRNNLFIGMSILKLIKCTTSEGRIPSKETCIRFIKIKGEESYYNHAALVCINENSASWEITSFIYERAKRILPHSRAKLRPHAHAMRLKHFFASVVHFFVITRIQLLDLSREIFVHWVCFVRKNTKRKRAGQFFRLFCTI